MTVYTLHKQELKYVNNGTDKFDAYNISISVLFS